MVNEPSQSKSQSKFKSHSRSESQSKSGGQGKEKGKMKKEKGKKNALSPHGKRGSTHIHYLGKATPSGKDSGKSIRQN